MSCFLRYGQPFPAPTKGAAQFWGGQAWDPSFSSAEGAALHRQGAFWLY